jgi:hypothetical protein
MGKAELQRAKYIKWLYKKNIRRLKINYIHHKEAQFTFSGNFADIAYNYNIGGFSEPDRLYIIEHLESTGYLHSSYASYVNGAIKLNPAASHLSSVQFASFNIGHRRLYDAIPSINSSLNASVHVISNPLFINEIENYIRDPVWNKHFKSTPSSDLLTILDIHGNNFKQMISLNPAAVHILKQHQEMIDWLSVIRNPYAIEFAQFDSTVGMQKKYAETQDPKLKAVLYRKIVKESISHIKKYTLRLFDFMYPHLIRYAEKKSIPDRWLYHATLYISY